MKEFKKNPEGHFICEECGRFFRSLNGLSCHISKKHKSNKIYFDNWIKEDGDDICHKCGNITKYVGFTRGYKITCSKECEYSYIRYKREETMLKKYGFKNAYQVPSIKDSIKQINILNLGVEYPMQSKKILEKSKQTCLIKYGCNNPAQNTEIFEKGLKTKLRRYQYKDTNLLYQGSYELDFLEKFYDKIDIENGPSIPYLFEGKNKVYHSDFFIPSLNLVVEIKSDYILIKHQGIKNAIEKKKATIADGFNYILIMNKKYNKLEKLISVS
jgi:hypothetical protein